MQNITVDAVFTDLIPLPAIEIDATLTLTIRKASGGTLSGGTFVYLAGIQWKLTFTPDTLEEVYAAEVTDEDDAVVFSQSYRALGTVWDATTGPTGTIVVGTNSWVTAQEAEDYFATRYGVGTNWSALSDVNKIAALISAHRYLNGFSGYEFPTTITQAMEDAQCETALFLIIHQADMDARQGLQAQGVVQAGIVQETYNKDNIGGLPIPVNVRSLLESYVTSVNFGAVDVARDDDEDVV